MIYRSANNSKRYYTWKDVQNTATAFGEGLCNLWDWQKGDILGVYAPNDIDFGPVVYGTFFAGGIASPANPAYSPDELAFQLKNAGAKALATTKAFLPNARKAAEQSGIPSDRIILIGEEKDDSHLVKQVRHVWHKGWLDGSLTLPVVSLHSAPLESVGPSLPNSMIVGQTSERHPAHRDIEEES